MNENNSNGNSNGNIKTRIDVAKLQQSFEYVIAELKKLDKEAKILRNEIINTREELKEDIAGIRGDIKVLFVKTGMIAAGSGSIAAIIIKFIG